MESPVRNHDPILIALDDDQDLLDIVGALAAQAGFSVTVTTDPEFFDEAVRLNDPDVIVLDLQMPKRDGVEVLRSLAQRRVQAGIVLLSGVDERTLGATELFARSSGLRVVSALQKPFMPEDLLERLRGARATTGPLTVEDLQKAIDVGQLMLYYQPTARRFGDGSWDIGAVEALLRWDHPERGVLTPDQFLSMGEEYGLIHSMTDYVMQRGVEQLRGWRASKLDLQLRINIAANLLIDIDFPDRLESLLGEQEVDPAAITLEVTETAMLEQHTETFDILTRLRLKNINLAIDDFGIGYSSLTQLFQMPFNEMKIDKSLVMQVPQSKEARIMVDALVGLAHKLRLSVCAEGVESKEVLKFLDEIGCDSAQGFFISRPVAAEEVPGVLERWEQSQRETFGSKLLSAEGAKR
jgi:EAL domain-containing protein (putative c-di-GMP-specific phosphodiesterase class I)/ActR/RegA family two-component response regulator